jgi:hypothetical protein
MIQLFSGVTLCMARDRWCTMKVRIVLPSIDFETAQVSPETMLVDNSWIKRTAFPCSALTLSDSWSAKKN